MKYFLLFFAVVIYFGCGSSAPKFTSKEKSFATEIKKEKVREKKNTEPLEENDDVILESTVGIASYYANKFHGRKTANGEAYNMNGLTAAHLNYSFGTEIKVTNLKNNKSVIVRINDRKPYNDGRVIDLSLGAAREIDMVKAGIAKVKLEILKWGNK